jgi:hypothetical protein
MQPETASEKKEAQAPVSAGIHYRIEILFTAHSSAAPTNVILEPRVGLSLNE